MQARTIVAASCLILGWSSLLLAETLSFPDHNFAIDLPAGWTKTDAPAPAVAAAKNGDGNKIFVIVAARLPDNERQTAIASMSHGAKEAAKTKGWKISSEEQTVINGITFESHAAEAPENGGTIMTWITSAGNEGYALQGIHKTGLAKGDAELLSIVRSFRLLSPATVNLPSTSYRLGYLLGKTCTCVMLPIILVIGIVWLVRRRKEK